MQSVDRLTSQAGIVALIALGLAVVALGCAILALVRQRRLAATQRVVLGPHDERDLITHAADLQAGYAALHEYVEDVALRLDERLGQAEAGVAGAFALRGLVRYDAYDQLSGHQSMTIALLDETRSGLVISSILHRDQARLYIRRLDRGEPDVPLSPEEQQAVQMAIDGGNPGRAAAMPTSPRDGTT